MSTPMTASAAVLPDGADLGRHLQLQRERVMLLAEQSAGAAGATFFGALLIGVVLATEVRLLEVLVWIALYLGMAIWRVAYSRQLARGAREPGPNVLPLYLGFAIFNGVWTGALPLVFFGHISVDMRVALTVVTLLAQAAGAVTFASYRSGYLWALALSMPPLAYAWWAYGGTRSPIVVATLTMFALLMVRLSRHQSDVFERSVHIRFEREAIVEQLRQEKAQTELARQRAEEASRAKSRFLANASHDLRQPAHALGLLTGVLEATAETQQHRDIARHIATASCMLAELLDNLLDISRLDAGVVSVTPKPVDLPHLLERLQTDARHLAGQRPIEVTADADDCVVMLDAVLVERALRNLIDNALKFTKEGRIHLSAHCRQTTLDIAVEDSGCGIPTSHHKLVFEEFYQIGNSERDRRRGLGLGLSIVARLSTLMGGEVSIQSQAGSGSKFILTLPLRHVAAVENEAPPPVPDRLDLRGWTVLVVDDEAMVRIGMRELLASWGATVDEADGLAQVMELPAWRAGKGWRACLCDLRLRGGEDGIDTARQLRIDLPGMLVMLITGDTAPMRIEEASRSGLPLLHKPVSPAQLARAIRKTAGD